MLRKTLLVFVFYSSSSWFISDDEGQEWYISKHYPINQELDKGSNVHDVALAGDGSWCVIRENKATFSTGVAKEVENQINNFFSRQKHRRQKRDIEIQHYKEEQIRKAKRLEREEAEMKRKKIDQRVLTGVFEHLKGGRGLYLCDTTD